MRVAVIDIGSPKKNNIGWAIVGERDDCGKDLDRCVESLACALESGPLVLGFEAPMFVPMRNKPKSLTEERCGEDGRAFSAGAGATVLVTSTVVVPYVLRHLKEAVPNATATLDWHGWRDNARPKQMLLFEAFVTEQKGTDDHVGDAKLAAKELHSKIKTGKKIESDVSTDEQCFSVLGAMMLRTGWSSDVGILSKPCLVIKPPSLE